MSDESSEENKTLPDAINLDSLSGTNFLSTEVAVDDSDGQQSINLDKAIGSEYDFRTLQIQLLKQQTESFIKKLRAQVAGGLATSLWVALIATGCWHTHMIGIIAAETMKNSIAAKEEIDFEAYDKASSVVGDTAKTLYAVISPLATAITGFYFVIQTVQADDDDE